MPHYREYLVPARTVYARGPRTRGGRSREERSRKERLWKMPRKSPQSLLALSRDDILFLIERAHASYGAARKHAPTLARKQNSGKFKWYESTKYMYVLRVPSPNSYPRE